MTSHYLEGSRETYRSRRNQRILKRRCADAEVAQILLYESRDSAHMEGLERGLLCYNPIERVQDGGLDSLNGGEDSLTACVRDRGRGVVQPGQLDNYRNRQK